MPVGTSPCALSVASIFRLDGLNVHYKSFLQLLYLTHSLGSIVISIFHTFSLYSFNNLSDNNPRYQTT